MKLDKKKIIVIFLAIIFITLILISFFQRDNIISGIKKFFKPLEDYAFSYKVTGYDEENDTFTLTIKIEAKDGIETIEYPENMILNCNGKKRLSFDLKNVKEYENYEIKIKIKGKTEIIENLIFEKQRIGKDTYKLSNGIYVNTPYIQEGYNPNYTRYLSYAEDGNLKPSNWIKDSEPSDWYDYKNQKWANIYVESEGIENYYVWIPRYVYKLDQDNQKSDVKFVDLYNNYTNAETGVTTNWETLKEEGYQLPQAFQFGDYREIELSGYWISKYQLSNLSEFKLDFNLTSSENGLNVINFKLKDGLTVNKYTYAINGVVEKETSQLEDYIFSNVINGENIVNITALDENGEIIASMTKSMAPVEVNEPELDGFDPDTTFYVWWDENGIEHNEIPISQEAPEKWYNYTYGNWANIVSRNDGLENYYVWIPRYAYKLNQTSERSDIMFIKGTETNVEAGYQIPEAFTWGDGGETQLTGYWVSKYQLSKEETNAKIDAEIATGSSVIKVRDIIGTAVITTNSETGEEEDASINFEYYLNGELKHIGTNRKENYVYEGLQLGTTYTVNIIARDVSTNEYIGAITKKVKTAQPNEPDLTGFNPDVTYYVTYDLNGEEHIGNKITEQPPNDWYNYSNRIWANIVVQSDDAVNYYTWIPRYEYKILSSLADWSNRDISNARTEINFIHGIDNETTPGYKIPEAFTWGDNGEIQLTGYWISKYQLSN